MLDDLSEAADAITPGQGFCVQRLQPGEKLVVADLKDRAASPA